MLALGLLTTLSVFVPVPIATGWAWGKCEDDAFPDVEEELEDLAELPRVLRSYGRAVARVIRPKLGAKFNVTAFDAAGAACGRDQWAWDAEIKAFRPHGEPMVPTLARTRLLVVRRTAVKLVPLPADPDTLHPKLRAAA